MSRARIAILPVVAVAALAILTAIAPASARAAAAATSVVNGDAAPRASFPYLAFVFFQEGGSGEACTGTVVSSNVVLTAAHCVLDEALGALRPAAGFRVVTGSVEWESSERVVSAVSAVAIDPEYTPSGENAHWADAAVLQLSRPIAAPPVRLATSETWSPGTAALLAGWGKAAASQSGPTPVLRYGATAVQAPTFCAAAASHFRAAGQLCVLDSGNRLHSVCSGDSGGPLVVPNSADTSEPLQIGIASYVVSESCSPNSPQYYTRADLVAPWVAAEIAALAPDPAGSAASTPATAPAGALPRLGTRAAKALVRNALSRSFGRSFDRGTGYRAACEALEATKRSCEVGWRRGSHLYGGWVTVYYALEENRVVWRYSMRVRRRAAAVKSAASRGSARSAAGARGRSGPR